VSSGGSTELVVFGRTEYAEPLSELGAADAKDDLLAVYPGPWVELVAFPSAARHWIIRDGEEVGRERRVRAAR
jgi:hypothetical protein